MKKTITVLNRGKSGTTPVVAAKTYHNTSYLFTPSISRPLTLKTLFHSWTTFWSIRGISRLIASQPVAAND